MWKESSNVETADGSELDKSPLKSYNKADPKFNLDTKK